MSSSSGSSSNVKTVSLNVSQCPIEKVVVYQPGARVSRSVKFDPTEIGSYKIVVEGICSDCNTSSLSIGGTGGCRIEDVTTQTIKKRREDVKSEYTDATKTEINQLISELKELADQERKIKRTISLTDQKKELVKAHVSSQLTNTPKDGFSEFKLPDTETALSLLNVYGETSEKLEDEKRKLTAELENELVPKRFVVIDRLRALLGNIWIPRESAETAIESVTRDAKEYEMIDVTVACVDLEVLNLDLPIKLDMTYQVHSARWSASYDIRSHDHVADVHMFGNVSQWSGEDWKDVRLSLSSANIQEDKVPPTLPSQTVGFKPPQPQPQPQPRRMMAKKKMLGMARPGLFGSAASGTISSASMEEEETDSGFVMETADYINTTVEGTGISTSYAIERQTTIAANSESHKVTIATLELPCELFRYAVPSLSNNVFIQAKLNNLSDYQFLDSNEVSVYLDGSFVGKTALSKRVAPTETCFLCVGTDPNVSMTHIPPKPFTKESGLISKTRQQTFESTTYLTPAGPSNTSNVLIAIVSALPSSTDGKIVVKLMEPDSPTEIDSPNDNEAAVKALELSRGRRSSYINTANNHIINIVVLSGSKVSFKTKYLVDWPADKKIEVVKQHDNNQ